MDVGDDIDVDDDDMDVGDALAVTKCNEAALKCRNPQLVGKNSTKTNMWVIVKNKLKLL